MLKYVLINFKQLFGRCHFIYKIVNIILVESRVKIVQICFILHFSTHHILYKHKQNQSQNHNKVLTLYLPLHPFFAFTADCVAFLKRQAESLGLPVKVYEATKNKPIVILTWAGTDPTLPAVLLNSHMDVVPVFEVHINLVLDTQIEFFFLKDKWTHKPFSADLVDGKIYARGTQDMKCVGIQYLEAIRYLKEEGVRLKRTVHVSFVPGNQKKFSQLTNHCQVRFAIKS